ncbi:F-box/LRR-repeat protein [Glycine max]|nr:F-box/LRR-repeat protein [Glycine max]
MACPLTLAMVIRQLRSFFFGWLEKRMNPQTTQVSLEVGKEAKGILTIKKKIQRTSGSDRQEERDRLSEFPDCVLLHILEFMNTTDAVRTCILSKRWKDLWKGLTSFSFMHFYFRNVDNFNRFVEGVLCYRDHSISLLNLHFRAYSSTACKLLDMIIRYALLFNVQQLTIESGFNFRNMPKNFVPLMFSCPTLITLKLCTTFPLELPKSLLLPALKTLHLVNMIFTASDNDCAEPFSNCNLLNTLVLQYCSLHNDVKVLHISNSNLSSLEMDDTLRFTNPDSFQRKIVLSTPNLSSLTIGDSFSYHQVSSTCNLSFLEEANVDTPSNIDYCDIKSLLQLLINVKILTLSARTLKIILNIGVIGSENESICSNVGYGSKQAPLELVGLGSSSSMDSFASWKMNDSGIEKEEREEMLGVFEGKGTLGKLKLKRRMQSGRDRTEDKEMMSDKWLCFSVQTYVLYIGEIFHYPHTEFLTLYQPHPFQQICIFCAVSSRGFFFPA